MRLVRDRWRVGVQAWHLLPAPLRDALAARHTARSQGCPGPWLGSWVRYGTTGAWRYAHYTDALPFLQITSIMARPTWWDVHCTGYLPPGWGHARVLVWHYSAGPWVLGWTLVPAALPVIEVDYPEHMVPLSDLCIIPTLTGSAKRCGVGDAHPLP